MDLVRVELRLFVRNIPTKFSLNSSPLRVFEETAIVVLSPFFFSFERSFPFERRAIGKCRAGPMVTRVSNLQWTSFDPLSFQPSALFVNERRHPRAIVTFMDGETERGRFHRPSLRLWLITLSVYRRYFFCIYVIKIKIKISFRPFFALVTDDAILEQN